MLALCSLAVIISYRDNRHISHITLSPRRPDHAPHQISIAGIRAEPDMPRLHLSTHRHDGTVTVTVAGELDIATAPDLKSYVHKILLAGPGRVVLNVGRVSFIGAAGLGALVAIRVRAEQQHTALLLADVPAAILGVLKLTRLDDQFDYLTVSEDSPHATWLARGPGQWIEGAVDGGLSNVGQAEVWSRA